MICNNSFTNFLQPVNQHLKINRNRNFKQGKYSRNDCNHRTVKVKEIQGTVASYTQRPGNEEGDTSWTPVVQAGRLLLP